MKIHILTAVIVGGVLVVGCDEQNAPTELTPEPAFDWMNGPSSPGPVVLRSEMTWAWLMSHEDETYVVLYGLGALDPSESWMCGGQTDWDMWTFQDIMLPNGAVPSSSRSQLTTHIWAFDDFYDPANMTFCDRLTSARVAEGYATVKYNDNDAYGSGTRNNAFSFRGYGILNDVVSGGYTEYRGIHKYIWFTDGSTKANQEKVTLDHID